MKKKHPKTILLFLCWCRLISRVDANLPFPSTDQTQLNLRRKRRHPVWFGQLPREQLSSLLFYLCVDTDLAFYMELWYKRSEMVMKRWPFVVFLTGQGVEHAEGKRKGRAVYFLPAGTCPSPPPLLSSPPLFVDRTTDIDRYVLIDYR